MPRLFFALWLPPQAAKVLHTAGRELQKACGGKLTRRETVHLTLVFLGEVEDDKIPLLTSLAAQVRMPAFRVCFDRYGGWKHNRIVWAMPTEIPAALAELVQGLEAGLKQEDFVFDRRPYVPHITLLRRARQRPEAADLPVAEWEVEEFVLVRSVQSDEGSAYEVIGRWPLGEPSPAGQPEA
jgi:2'-5' RNA ligase